MGTVTATFRPRSSTTYWGRAWAAIACHSVLSIYPGDKTSTGFLGINPEPDSSTRRGRTAAPTRAPPPCTADDHRPLRHYPGHVQGAGGHRPSWVGGVSSHSPTHPGRWPSAATPPPTLARPGGPRPPGFRRWPSAARPTPERPWIWGHDRCRGCRR
jgi:hypothetical protein